MYFFTLGLHVIAAYRLRRACINSEIHNHYQYYTDEHVQLYDTVQSMN